MTNNPEDPGDARPDEDIPASPADPTRTSPPDEARDRPDGADIAALDDRRLPAPLQYRDPGRYEIIAEHGRGGLGRVLRARDRELGRPVAVKELLRRGATSETRFFREALITARLEHPNIVPVHEAGRWPDGTPFYAMKLVAGRPLSELIERASTPHERLAVIPHLIAVADAIAYAHSRRIIHRDLKPSNVIVGDFGETIVIDWGLAKDFSDTAPEGSTGSNGPVQDGVTQAGSVLGTPAYMSPEQAAGKTVDHRTDIYSLGAMLLLLIEGSPSPSVAASDLSHRAIAPAEEVLAIARKAMASQPEARYASAADLADDLRRFLAGQLVHAHDYNTRALAARWLRRHRTKVVFASLLILLASTFAVASYVRVSEERDLANLEKRRAETARALADQRAVEAVTSELRRVARDDPSMAPLLMTRLRELDPAVVMDMTTLKEIALRPAASHMFHLGDGERGILAFSVDASALIASTATRLHVWTLDQSGSVRVHEFASARTAIAVQRARVLTGHVDGSIYATDLESGATRFLLSAGAQVTDISVNADASIAVVTTAAGNILVIRDDGRAPVTVSGHHASATSSEFSPDGRHLLTWAADGSLRLWSTATFSAEATFQAPSAVELAAFSSDGRMIAAGTADVLLAWDLPSHRLVAKLVPLVDARPWRLAATNTANRFVVHCSDDTLRTWSPGGPLEILAQDHPTLLALTRHGVWLAYANEAKQIWLMDAETGFRTEFRGHSGSITSLALSSDGRFLASLMSSGRFAYGRLRISRRRFKGCKARSRRWMPSPTGCPWRRRRLRGRLP